MIKSKDGKKAIIYLIDWLILFNTKTMMDTKVEKTTLICAQKQNSAIQCSNREWKKTQKTYTHKWMNINGILIEPNNKVRPGKVTTTTFSEAMLSTMKDIIRAEMII